MTRVLVCGGREFGCLPRGMMFWSDAQGQAAEEAMLLRDTLDTLMVDRGIAVVIHGAARGADALAGQWARRKLIKEEPYKADWYPNGAMTAGNSERRPQREMPTCASCTHFAPLKPGHAAICFERWKGLPWNAAVPLTSAGESCDKHATRPYPRTRVASGLNPTSGALGLQRR